MAMQKNELKKLEELLDRIKESDDRFQKRLFVLGHDLKNKMDVLRKAERTFQRDMRIIERDGIDEVDEVIMDTLKE